MILNTFLLMYLFVSVSCTSSSSGDSKGNTTTCLQNFGTNSEWSSPTEVVINGYSQNAMEPKVSSDQVVLFWNDKPSSDDQMSLHYAVKDGLGVYQYVGVLTGTVDSDDLDGVPSIDLSGNFYFVSTRTYATNSQTVFGGTVQVTGPSAIQINGVTASDSAVTAGVPGTLDMDIDVTWDGLQMVISRATFAGNPYPETSSLKYYDVSSRVLSARSDTDSVFQNVNFSNCRTYAGSLSRDKLEVFFTVFPTGSTFTGNDFRIVVAKRTSTTEAFTNPQIIQSITGLLVEGPTPTYDDLSKTLFYHLFDAVSGKFKIYKVTRN